MSRHFALLPPETFKFSEEKENFFDSFLFDPSNYSQNQNQFMWSRPINGDTAFQMQKTINIFFNFVHSPTIF